MIKDYDISSNELLGFCDSKRLALPSDSGLLKEIKGNNRRIVEGVCNKTGIITAIIMPTIFTDFNLEYEIISPLADIKNVRRLVKDHSNRLEELDNNTLAGIVYVLYTNLGLFVSHEDSPVVSNGVLSTAKKETLLKAIILGNAISSTIAKLLPPLNIDIAMHKEGYANFNPILANQIILLKQEILEIKQNAMLYGNKKQEILEVNYSNPAYSKLTKPTKSDDLVAFESAFIEARASARNALRLVAPVMLTIPKYTKTATFLKNAITGKNMITVSKEIKDKLTLRLEEYKEEASLNYKIEVQKVIDFIASSYNAEDKASPAKVKEAIERFSDNLPKQAPKTIQELLALKLAQKNKE
jgi:hypothetical protein